MKMKRIIFVLVCMMITVLVTSCAMTYGHEHIGYEITTNPTLDEVGSATAKCTCGEDEIIVIPALNDATVWTLKSSTAPTCTETGAILYESIYGEVVVILPTLDHDYTSYEIVIEPTLYEVGIVSATCSFGETATLEIPALSDTTVWKVKSTTASDCSVAGNTVYKSIYGEVVVTLPTLGHDYVSYEITTSPTLNKVGIATATCIYGETASVKVPALSDTTVWSVKSTTPSTCSVAGNTVYKSVYGEVVVALATLAHDYTASYEIVTNPTTTTVGSMTATCICGASTTKEVPTLSDTTVWTVKSTTPSTCSVAGNTVYQSIYGEVVVALGTLPHDYTASYEIVTNPTTTTVGSMTATCICGASTTKEVPTLSDTTVWTVKSTTPSTCSVAGNTVYQSIYGEVVVALGTLPHDYTASYEIVTNPTTTTVGSMTATCSCGASTTVDVPVLSDTSVWNVSEVAADYNKAGSKTYTSVYGEVVVVTPKLVAPYDGKTYVSLNVEPAVDSVFTNGVITPADTWSNAAITFDENGCGQGSGYPFRGYFEITMVDPTTGKILVTRWDIMDSGEDDADGNSIYIKNPDVSKIREFTGYVDFATGIIVCDAEQFAEINFWVPFDAVDSDDLIASAWDNSLAMTYTDPNGALHNVFVYKGVSYFNVSFTDVDGNDVAANECYNATLVYVKDSNNNVLNAFAYNGEKLVDSDGLQGTYVNGEETIFVSGAGVATYNGVSATYVIADSDANYTIGLYVGDSYYEITLAGNAFTANKPMVTITYNAFDKADLENAVVNKNIALVLPNPTCLTHTFKGWFYDADCTMPVESTFIPTSDVTLYASWKEKIVVNLVGVLEGDSSVIYLGEGDVIGQFLPSYNIELSIGKKFVGWFIDENFEMSLPEEYEITMDDSGVVIYACWEDIPAYYGTYKGPEIWNASYGNSSVKTLTIDENGNMSGFKTGIIISYNPETQTIEWKTNASATNVYKFYFNAKLGIIAGLYNNNDIGNDYYIMSRDDADGKATAHYGIKAAKSPVDSSRGWYAQFVNMTTALGDVEIFLYNNHIYDTFTATDAFGNPLTAATVKDSKTLIVKDAEGNIIVSVASKGTSFSANSDTIDLDPYFGTYTNGEEEVTLDGVGNIAYGELVGTYTVATAGSSYGFDIYFNDNTSYYELTLDGTSFTIVKVMVTITYEEGAYATIEDASVNKNISFKLPVLSHETNVFNGWYFDAEFTQPVGTEFVPTADVTLYALWKVKVTLTVNPNNGSETQTIVYSEGDVVEIENPTLKGQKFVGWYTSEDFADGTEWSNGSEITADTVIYAKWEEAPAYYNTYTATRLEFASSSKTTGLTYSYCYKSYSTGPYIFDISAEGTGKGTNAPLNGSYSIQNYNPETGYLELVLVDSYNTSSVYKGYLDKTTGIIITTYTSGMDKNFDKVLFYNPFTTEEVSTSVNLSSSYWSFGGFRAIEYTYEGITYGIFVNGNDVIFGVTFEDAAGNAVTGAEAYTQSALIVKNSTGEVVAKFAMGDAELELMDGNEGTYINGSDTLVIDGVKTATLNGVAGTYKATAEGSAYGFDVYVGGSYYEVTLNKEDGTYTINKSMVTISFVVGDQAVVDAVNTNKNIEITLPVPTNDNYVFRGWFADAEFTQAVNNAYLPTVDATLYAKWDVKVTLTVVYGNGLDNASLEYGAGDTATPVEPPFTDGKVFNGWFLDAEFTTPYEVGAINEDTTIYCKWMESVAMYGSYKGFNLFGAGNKNITYFSTSLTVTADGQVSGTKTGAVSNYDSETGSFMIGDKYYAVYDELGGAIAVAYGTNSTGIGTDLYLLFKKTAVSGAQSANLNGSFIKLITINFDDGTSENYLVMNDMVYSGVTWTGDYTAYTAGNASSLTIYARDGQTVLLSY